MVEREYYKTVGERRETVEECKERVGYQAMRARENEKHRPAEEHPPFPLLRT